MAYERLTSTDAAFLYIETAHEPQHVGSLSEIEGGPLRDDAGRIRIDELRAFSAGRLHRVPRLRQRVMPVPFNVGHPIWVDDESFDIDYHVRLSALPRPGDGGQLEEMFARVQAIPLDRDRPLWEMWFVDGLEHDRVGLIIKTHHALGDGIANVDLVLALVDVEREPPPDPPAPEFEPSAAPSSPELLVNSTAERLTRPVALGRSAFRSMSNPKQVRKTVTDAVASLNSLRVTAGPASWNTVVGAHRRWVRADVSLAEVKEVCANTETTVNDVVLEICTDALRDFLLGHGEDVEGRTLKAMVPVSRRADDEHGAVLGNRVSLIVADLPVDEDDPARRLERIHEQTSELKASGLADGIETVVSAAGEFAILAPRLAKRLSQTAPMNLVITNIPGPPVSLYVRGAKVLRAYPYVEIIDNAGLTIAVVSYEGNMSFGITADRDVLPDLQLLADGIEAGLGRLQTATAD
jgi:diacylglycerol O-acyltransferase